MPVVLTDVQIAFAAGALFADAGAPVIEAARRRSEASLAAVYHRHLLRSLVYAAFFLGPGATVFMLAYPAWETQYISPIFDRLPGRPDYAAFYGLFLMGLFAGGWFGNWLGFRWVLRGWRKRLRALYVAVAGLSFAVFFARYPAPARLGSYAAFRADPDALPWVTEDRTFFVTFLILLALTGLPILVTFLLTRREVGELRRGSTRPTEAAPAGGAGERR
ncbi:MAG TPA: hypothetical protein VN228_20345 [Pyrinomonadaceae bacterium]|nr:hypothetical protein [Pyrinomonadaceae bacterium]